MVEKIGRRKALSLLKKVVKGNEDFVYGNGANLCQYFERDGSPSCIVGHVLAEMGYGVSDLDIAAFNDHDLMSWSDCGQAGEIFTDGALHVLGVAQRAQDSQVPWGGALAEALSVKG